MKLVTTTGELSKRFGDERALEILKEAGFDGYDYSMFIGNWKELFDDGFITRMKKVAKKAASLGLPCLQAHSPCLMKCPNTISLDDYVALTIRAIEGAAELECPIIVVHPAFPPLTTEDNCKRLYGALMPTAERLGVVVATENMFSWKDETEAETIPTVCGTAANFIEHIDLLPHPNFTAGLDLGHAQMVNCEGAVALIKALGKKRIGALHVHDNDLFHDDHTFPFVGQSSWEEITSALAEIGYENAFTFEADSFMSRYPDELLPSCEILLHDTGRYLINLIETKKK